MAVGHHQKHVIFCKITSFFLKSTTIHYFFHLFHSLFVHFYILATSFIILSIRNFCSLLITSSILILQVLFQKRTGCSILYILILQLNAREILHQEGTIRVFKEWSFNNLSSNSKAVTCGIPFPAILTRRIAMSSACDSMSVR